MIHKKMARAHACFVLEVCDGVVNSVPAAAAAAANSVPWGRRGGGGASYLDAIAFPCSWNSGISPEGFAHPRRCSRTKWKTANTSHSKNSFWKEKPS